MITKSKASKFVAGLVGVAVALSFVFGGVVAPAQAQTVSDLQAQIAALQALIAQLSGSTGGSTVSTGYTFNTNLQVGQTSTDVMNLQKVLNASSDTQVSTSGAGAPGAESSYFGAKTKAAVIKFQLKNNLPGTGFVGPMTRNVLNSMNTGTGNTGNTGGTGSVTPVAGGLTVTAAAQPANSLAPQSASRIPFTKVTLTAGSSDVTVNSITVEKAGLADDAVFSGVVLLDDSGQQIGISKTLNSNHQAMVGEPWVIKAGTSKTVTIAGNMAADLSTKAGQVAGLRVVAVNTAGTVSGALPITGALHTINASLSLGSVDKNVSSFDPNTSTTKEIGTTAYKFAGIRLTAGSAEKIRLWSVRWNQSGSASANDLANVMVNVDGTDYPTTLSSDGKYYTSTFGSGIVVDKGFSKDIYIKGDVIGTGAAGRTVKFDIYKNTDVYITGETYGYGVIPSVGSGTASDSSSEFTAGTPWFDGSKVTVSAGSVTTAAKATSVPAQNIAKNVPNQPLGGYELDVKGEPITVNSTVVHFTSSVAASTFGLLTNVTIVDQNGSVVAGPFDATVESGTNQKVTFSSSITYPVGKNVYQIKGKLPSSGPSNNDTIVASTTPSSDWTTITGQTTGNTITLSNGQITMNTMTVKSASLSIAVSSNPASQNIVAGTSGKLFSNIQLDATASGEDVRFSTIPLKLTFTGDTANELSGCQLFDGATALTTGSNVVNPSSSVTTGSDVTFTLDNSYVVTKGTSKTIAVKCNISSQAAAAATYSWGLSASPSITVTGVTSSGDVTESVTAATGPTMTVASAGTLTVGLDSSSPAYKVEAAGTTGVTLGVLKFTSTNEPINLNKVAVQMDSASSSPADLVNNQVTIWDGATQVGTAVFQGSNTFATSTLTTSVVVPKDSTKTLTIKGDIAAIGTGQPATSGHLIKVNYDNDDSTGTQGVGADSGSTINRTSSSDTSVPGVRIFKSYPVMTYSTTGATAFSGTNDLLSLNVAANSTGEVQLYKLTFAISTTTATVSSPEFVGPNGSVGTVALNSAGTEISVTFDSSSNTQDKVIAAGSSKSYTLKGLVTLTGTNSTGSVSVSLKADTAYPSLASFMAAVGSLSSSATIWSPSSTTTAATTANDWTNGYGLPGCFASAGLGSNCSARVIAK